MTTPWLDVNLPYEGQWVGRNAGRARPAAEPWFYDVANFLDQDAAADNPDADPTSFGMVSVRHDWLLNTAKFDDQSNTKTIDIVVAASDAKRAVVDLLGICKGPLLGAQGVLQLNRVLPVQDPDGWGMFATAITGMRYVAPSGILVRETAPDQYLVQEGNALVPNQEDQAPDGSFENDAMSIWNKYIPIEQIDFSQKLMKRYLYIQMAVQFEQPRFVILPDDLVPESDVMDERCRYMTGGYTSASEFVTLKGGIIAWSPYDCNKVDPATGLNYRYTDVPLPDDAQVIDKDGTPVKVGTDQGFIRPTGEHKVVWYGLDELTLSMLMQKIVGTSEVFSLTGGNAFAGCIATPCTTDPSADLAFFTDRLVGCVNDDCLSLPYQNHFTTYGPQQILLLEPHIEELIFPTGFRKYNLILTFAYRREGWNKFFSPLANKVKKPQDCYWRAVYVSQDGTSRTAIYQPANLNRVFEVSA